MFVSVVATRALWPWRGESNAPKRKMDVSSRWEKVTRSKDSSREEEKEAFVQMEDIFEVEENVLGLALRHGR